MLKFILISFIVWFIIFRLFRFKFVVYKNGYNAPPQKKPEGTITIKSSGKKSPKGDGQNDGEYVEFEEI